MKKFHLTQSRLHDTLILLMIALILLVAALDSAKAQNQPPSQSGSTNRNALFFNGVNQSVTATVNNFSMTSGTYEVWIKKADWTDFHDDVLLSNGIPHDQDNSFYLSLSASGGLQLRYGGESQTGNGVCQSGIHGSPSHFEPYSWHHIAATWLTNAGQTQLKLFIDGNDDETSNADLSLPAGNSIIIGFNPSSGYFGEGSMAEARLWNVAKSESEIANAMNSQLTGSEGGLIAYWPFDETSGTTAANKVANASAATLTNMNAINWQRASFSPGLWGMTSEGGLHNYGIIFRTASDGTNLVTEYEFEDAIETGRAPYADLIEADNGKFYGMTSAGGDNTVGVIFEYDPSDNAYTTKYHFDGTNGSKPRSSLVQASNGKLYGVTEYGGDYDLGVLFEFDLTTNTYTRKFDFDFTNGKLPLSRLVSDGNTKLWGTAPQGGAHNQGILFEYDFTTNTFTKRYDFGTIAGDGVSPTAGLTLVNGKFYGMTVGGGLNNYGTVFEFDPSGAGACTKKYDFEEATGAYPIGYLTLANNGKLYGLASGGGSAWKGSLFEYESGTTTIVNKANFNGLNGDNPNTSLTLAGNGKLYGMTYQGHFGDNTEDDPDLRYGVLFEYDPQVEQLVAKVKFNEGNGSHPFFNSPTLGSNGKLYGMTWAGGVGSGMIFEFNPSTNQYAPRFAFNGLNKGANPRGNLLQYSNQKLYGMTSQGGSTGNGVLFEYDMIQKEIITRWSFNANEKDGSNPQGSLIQMENGKLYGLTYGGGSDGYGTLFEFDPLSNVYAKKVDFNGDNGNSPYGNLIEANGKLYGMTYQGGVNGVGNLFEYNPSTGLLNSIHDFNYDDGSYPSGSLIVVNGKLYGMTQEGGDDGDGVLFEYDLASGTYNRIYNFQYAAGSAPYGDVTLVNNSLFGMTSSGGDNDDGTVFEYDLSSGDYTVRYHFDGDNGYNPYGSLTLGSNGKLYGMAYQGGDQGYGVLFEYGSTSGFVKKHDFIGDDASYPYYTKLALIQAKQMLTFNELTAKVYGNADFNLSGSTDSGLPITYTSNNTDAAVISNNTVAITGAGTAVITATQAGSNYFATATVSQTLTVNKKPLTITAENKSRPYKTSNPDLTISYAGFVNGESVSDITAPTVSVAATINSDAGTYPITLADASAANYELTLVNGTLTITKLDQVVTFSEVTTKTMGAAPFALEASSDTGLPIVFTSTKNHTTISEATATLVSAGSETIIATQAGNQNYNEASVSRTFCINPAKPVINADFSRADAPVLTSSAATGNQWYLEDVLIIDATQATYTVDAPGSYSVQASPDGCQSEVSDKIAVIITAVTKEDVELAVFPNPTESNIGITSNEAGVKGIEIINANGRVMHRESMNGSSVSVAVDQWPSGMYLVNITSAKGKQSIRFIRK